jgi:hypothetical protein
MTGSMGDNGRAIGHSGGGPFSVNAVYHFPDRDIPVTWIVSQTEKMKAGRSFKPPDSLRLNDRFTGDEDFTAFVASRYSAFVLH